MVPPQSPSGICTLIQSDYEGPPTISLKYMYSYAIWLWWFPHNLPQVYVLLSNLTMRVPPQSPSDICTLIQSDYEGPSPQSPSGIGTLIQSDYDGPPTISLKSKCICTLIQSEYEGPPTISLRYIMYSYPIWLWGSPHNLPEVYVLLSNLTMRVPHNLPRVYVLIQSDYEGPPQSPSGICTLIQSNYEGPPQSPSGICTLIQSDYEGPPTISLRYMYSYSIWLWWSPHNIPQVYVLLSNLTMMVPPQSPSGICSYSIWLWTYLIKDISETRYAH